ncbi:MAG: thiamine pyrophosphate-dependent enzyme [Gaiellaceae bacterium]
MTGDFLMTGAEAVALVLRESETRSVFVYAGTSELALCDAIAATPEVDLMNGRGDKESAMMAAGASLLVPTRGAAVLHGARGLTNAAGAVADARRNEAGAVFVVGLPATASARFLPPHAEPGLIQSVGAFAKWAYEAGPVPDEPDERAREAQRFVAGLRTAVEEARRTPHGPTLFGIPQDVAEAEWIPRGVFVAASPAAVDAPDMEAALSAATAALAAAAHPLVLIDDYLLHYDGARPALAELASRVGAPVLQVRYRRGPMLFERLSAQDVPTFSGWLDPGDEHHRRLLAETDLLVTVEDRNMYPRVVGELPECPKLAITSDPAKARKNEYLGDGDMLVEGDPVALLERLCERLEPLAPRAASPTWAEPPGAADAGPAVPLEPHVERLRVGIVSAIGDAMARCELPVIVDDSQMFGGMVSEHYDLLAPGIRVFGGHGGFVGGGISYATGLALANPSAHVLCTLGDQAFTNNLQGLVAAGEHNARVVCLVCNNGESVSLLKQSRAGDGSSEARPRPYLRNVQDLDYAHIASELGIAASSVELRVDGSALDVEAGIAAFEEELEEALAFDGPSLVEMRLPSLGAFWAGVWIVEGFEEPAVPAKVSG